MLGRVTLDQAELAFPLQGAAVSMVQILEQCKSLKSFDLLKIF